MLRVLVAETSCGVVARDDARGSALPRMPLVPTLLHCLGRPPAALPMLLQPAEWRRPSWGVASRSTRLLRRMSPTKDFRDRGLAQSLDLAFRTPEEVCSRSRSTISWSSSLDSEMPFLLSSSAAPGSPPSADGGSSADPAGRGAAPPGSWAGGSSPAFISACSSLGNLPLTMTFRRAASGETSSACGSPASGRRRSWSPRMLSRIWPMRIFWRGEQCTSRLSISGYFEAAKP
mmetsp:Transcript_43510/g.124703  ORF Transcript_43510/g.124703 Transcript_43510/m.124703 type:complete len:232 (+) Transcript_43510:931-1626(+)